MAFAATYQKRHEKANKTTLLFVHWFCFRYWSFSCKSHAIWRYRNLEAHAWHSDLSVAPAVFVPRQLLRNQVRRCLFDLRGHLDRVCTLVAVRSSRSTHPLHTQKQNSIQYQIYRCRRHCAPPSHLIHQQNSTQYHQIRPASSRSSEPWQGAEPLHSPLVAEGFL